MFQKFLTTLGIKLFSRVTLTNMSTWRNAVVLSWDLEPLEICNKSNYLQRLLNSQLSVQSKSSLLLSVTYRPKGRVGSSDKKNEMFAIGENIIQRQSARNFQLHNSHKYKCGKSLGKSQPTHRQFR
jgi:hypothetical protein